MQQWEVKDIKARVFMGAKVTDALKAFTEFFEPIEKDCTLLAITIEYPIEPEKEADERDEVVIMAVWEE